MQYHDLQYRNDVENREYHLLTREEGHLRRLKVVHKEYSDQIKQRLIIVRERIDVVYVSYSKRNTDQAKTYTKRL